MGVGSGRVPFVDACELQEGRKQQVGWHLGRQRALVHLGGVEGRPSKPVFGPVGCRMDTLGI